MKEKSPPLWSDEILYFKRVVLRLMYCTLVIDCTMILALSTTLSEKNGMKIVISIMCLLNYASIHSNVTIEF